MNKFSKNVWRVGIVGVVAIALSLVMVVRLARLQLTAEAAGVNDNASANTVETTRVTLKTKAMRGEITDRYGRELITNTVTNNIQLEYALWNRNNQNAVIAELIGLCAQYGAEPRADTVPLEKDRPEFVESWSDPEEKSASFSSFMKKRGWNEALNAGELWDELCGYFDIGEEYDYKTARAIVGVRFNMERYDFAYSNPFVFAENVDRELALLLNCAGYTMKGVRVTYDYEREYATTFAAHILGRTGGIYAEEYEELAAQGYAMNDTVGKDGAEKAFESYLRGTDGSVTLELDGDGRVVRVVSETEARAGYNVMLTIDLRLQEAVENALADQIRLMVAEGLEDPEKHPTDVGGGAAVVIDVNSGEILALASYPTFDISRYSELYNEMLADELLPMFNRAVSGIYSPGSTFKVVTSVACLEEGIIRPDTVIEDLGRYTFYKDFQPECWIYREAGVTHGDETVITALRDSCNYFFYETGRLLGIEKLSGYASAFGLGEYTGIEIPGESKGYVASPESKMASVGVDWVGGDVLQASIGQSYNMFTPLQICNCIATLVNGGTRYECHLLKYVAESDYSSVANATQSVIAKRIEMSEVTHDTVLQGMSEVTENGTASTVFSKYEVHVGGKTGSVQVSDGTANSVFVAFAPFEDPEIAVAVIVEHGGSGNGIAPIALEIFKTYFALQEEYGIETAEQTIAN
ncbi:MAG: penicillin-binding transpeptidase domain-containing protein [Clostridiales bacterium]|nr:penicillin-binding transpeptidase domain-containing protein [Clostridiales bacterium]